MDNLQVHLHTAQYTKVHAEWGETMSAPPVCRLYYFRSGSGWIRHRSKEFRPEPGQLFLLPAGQPVAFGTDPEHTFEKFWCHFTASVGDVNLFQLLNTPAFVRVQDEERLTALFQDLILAYKSETLSAPLRVKAVLLDIVALYLELATEQHRPVTVSSTRETGKIDTVLAYIEQNLQQQMTVEELASLVHFHPNYFLPYFKSMMGVSPIAYINRKRIELAKRLLTSTDLPVTNIAERIGLEPYYFSRMFKKLAGQAPSVYRSYASAEPPR
jgi:AraC-like DNA-binding protein